MSGQIKFLSFVVNIHVYIIMVVFFADKEIIPKKYKNQDADLYFCRFIHDSNL